MSKCPFRCAGPLKFSPSNKDCGFSDKKSSQRLVQEQSGITLKARLSLLTVSRSVSS
jgi:hypothetical protein